MVRTIIIYQTLLFMEIKNKIIIFLLALCMSDCTYGQHPDGFDLVMKEVRIVNKSIKKCLYDVIPQIIRTYPHFNREKDVICVDFLPNEDLFMVYPKNKIMGLTDWFLYNNNYQVTGYLTIHNVMVIIMGNKSLSYLKTKRKIKIMHIENYPPPFDGVYPYWEYSIGKKGGQCILIKKDDPPKKDSFY